MNLNIVNLDPNKWDKQTWQDAYNLYCESNMFGAKTKREYYDMVISNFEKLAKKPVFHEINKQWLQGWRNAVAYAKKHKCDMNGQDLESCKPQVDLNELADDVKELQWQTMHK